MNGVTNVPQALVSAVDHPHRQPGPGRFAVEVQSQRLHRPAAAARLVGVEPAEKDAAAAGGALECERPGSGELVVEGFAGNPGGVIGRRRAANDLAADLALLLAGEIGRAVAKVLRDGRQDPGQKAVVVALPAGVLVERFAFDQPQPRRLALGPAAFRARRVQQGEAEQGRRGIQLPHPRRSEVRIACRDSPVASADANGCRTSACHRETAMSGARYFVSRTTKDRPGSRRSPTEKKGLSPKLTITRSPLTPAAFISRTRLRSSAGLLPHS